MSRPEDDAEASTMAAAAATLVERSSRPVIERLGAGAMVGRYRLDKRLGAGAMGVVWQGHDTELERDIAIKLVHPELARSSAATNRLKREAQAMAKLSHRSVIAIHDVGEVGGQVFIAMELVRGDTLGRLLRARTPEELRDWRRWLAMMVEAGRGLAEAHKNGVLHRDFKPDNVLVDGSGHGRVGDFGLASLGDRVEPSQEPTNEMPAVRAGFGSDLTTTGAVLGTPLYMSPQQLDGEVIDARADQFAYCVALHEAMYGRRPFTTDAQGLAAIPSLVEAIARGAKPPADSPVPAEIFEVIRRGLSFEPADRWPDMDALLAAIERVIRPARAESLVMRAMRRRRWPIVAAVVAVAAIAVVAVLATRRSSSSSAIMLEPLFKTALNTKTAMSPDGRVVALAGDQLEVRTIRDDGRPGESLGTIQLTMPIVYVEIDEHEVRFSSEQQGARWRWRYRESKEAIQDPSALGGWRGTTARGELIRDGSDRGLAIVDPAGGKQVWPVRGVEIVHVSPNGQHVAYIEGGRFHGRIGVRNVMTGAVVTSPELDEPKALAWLDHDTLLYTTSTMVEPKLFRVDIAKLDAPELVIQQPTGWFSDLAIGGGRVYIVSMEPTPRGVVIVREPSKLRRELDSVSLGIGWDDANTMLTWHQGNQLVSSHRGKLETEPANTTRVGDTLIATLRERGGRRAVAISLTTGKQLWWHDDQRTIAVRCAGDRQAPCFAIRYAGEHLDRIVTIDPATGTLGTTAIYEDARIEDLAVRADGQRMLVTHGGQLRELTADGSPVGHHKLDSDGVSRFSPVRSVAYTAGGFLVAGTVGRNNYQVGEQRGDIYDKLDEARDKILTLVRASPDGSQVTFVARGYEPQLFVMHGL